MDRVSEERNVGDVENRGAGDSHRLVAFEFDDSEDFSDREHDGKSEQKGERRELGKSKESRSPVYDSMLSMFDDFAANGGVGPLPPAHGFHVGDMVWGKVKSHPWWPGHVYSEELATASVRRSKREGLLLVAFFGDSSYGWFDHSELIPFDANFAEKSRQTSSRTFLKAVDEAVDEVCRRRALGLSCMCRNKQNFRQTGVAGFFSVDVEDYEPGAVYSVDIIKKARDSFQPRLALDFVRQLALAPTSSEHTGIEFIKNKATALSYRKAVYEEFDETYAQAFNPSPGSVQELPPGKTPPKAPLSGRQVFADTAEGKGKIAKPSKSKDHATKDKYLLKRRDTAAKEVKTHQKKLGKATSPSHVEDLVTNAAGDEILQRKVATTHDQIATGTGVSMERTPTVDDEEKVMPETEDIKRSSGAANEKPSRESKVLDGDGNGQEKVKVHKRPVGEVGSEKKTKRKKESLMSDSDSKSPKPIEDPHSKATTGLGGKYEGELTRVLGDLHSLALDPFHAFNRGRSVKVRRAFLRFRSLVFQKSLGLAEDEAIETPSRKSPSENAKEEPLARPDDPTKGGRKREISDRQEDIAAKKKKKISDIRSLKQTKRSVEPPVVNPTSRKVGPDSIKKTEPTMLIMRFPQGASLPSVNELKAKLGRYGPMDHSHTRTFWTSFLCRVVYKQKADAEEACKNVGGSSGLFGNADIKCYLKQVGVESEPPPPPVKVRKEAAATTAAQPPAAPPDTSGVQLKSCLKKSGGEEAGGNGGRATSRVKFVLGAAAGETNKNGNLNNNASFGDDGGASSFSSSSSSHSTMDINSSKSFQKAISPPSLPLPLPISTIVSQFTRPPSSSMHHGTDLAPPPPPPPPPLLPPAPPPNSVYHGTEVAPPLLPPPLPPNSMHHGTEVAPPPPPRFDSHNFNRPMSAPNNVDIAQQMLSLLTKCNDVVSNVTGLLGYVPYHPL